jgi:hypothetical protein
MRTATLALLAILASQRPGPPESPSAAIVLAEQHVDVPRAAELRAVVSAQCGECAWDTEGREAVTLVIRVDGRYSQHLPLVRGGSADYSVMLGSADAGRHTVRLEIDPATTASGLMRAGVATARLAITPVFPDSPEQLALALAPFVYARPDTVGRFTDVPVFMWYEREPTERGALYRYSVIFTNEDGGTPTDRLMATWGRTTDIEYLYSVEVDRAGGIVAEDYQGPEHEVRAFRGKREGRHPLLWVATDNNMVRDVGDVAVRYAPAPQSADLTGVARESLMDANPWLYAVMAQELRREGKIVDDAPPGQDRIPDPRRFVYVEACGEVGNAALAFAIGGVRLPTSAPIVVGGAAAGRQADRARSSSSWLPSDRGLRRYRIVRDGCFRAAIPVPAGTRTSDLRALRVFAYERPPSEGKPPVPPTPVRLTHINKLFLLDEQFVPGRSLLKWQGTEAILVDGAPFEIRIP